MPSRPPSPAIRNVARVISIVGHPFVTTLVLAGAARSEDGKSIALPTTVAAGLLFILPLAVLTVRQVRRGAWGTVDASQPKERPLLFAVGMAGLLLLLAWFARTQPGSGLVRGTAGVLVMVGICAALTPWVKVSLHLAAAALAAAVLLERGLALGWFMTAGLPLLAWSRVALGRHRWREVALGLVIGACTGAVLIRLG